MAIKGAKTIAEYAIRRWLEENHFDMEWFELNMHGNEAILTDRVGSKLHLRYDNQTRLVEII